MYSLNSASEVQAAGSSMLLSMFGQTHQLSIIAEPEELEAQDPVVAQVNGTVLCLDLDVRLSFS